MTSSSQTINLEYFSTDGSTLTEKVNYEVEGSDVIIQGDIIVGDVSELLNSNNFKLNNYSQTLAREQVNDSSYSIFQAAKGSANQRRWPRGIVPVLLNGPFGLDLEKIVDHIDNLNKSFRQRNINIIFVPTTKENPTTFPLTITKPEGYNGCSASLGYSRLRNNLSWGAGCHSSRIPQRNTHHELLHNLGLIHEHVREERDEHVNIILDNIKEDKKHNFIILPNSIGLGPYDKYSIMHYQGYAHAIDPNRPTITDKENFAVPVNESLSDGDYDGLHDMYGDIRDINHFNNYLTFRERFIPEKLVGDPVAKPFIKGPSDDALYYVTEYTACIINNNVVNYESEARRLNLLSEFSTQAQITENVWKNRSTLRGYFCNDAVPVPTGASVIVGEDQITETSDNIASVTNIRAQRYSSNSREIFWQNPIGVKIKKTTILWRATDGSLAAGTSINGSASSFYRRSLGHTGALNFRVIIEDNNGNLSSEASVQMPAANSAGAPVIAPTPLPDVSVGNVQNLRNQRYSSTSGELFWTNPSGVNIKEILITWNGQEKRLNGSPRSFYTRSLSTEETAFKVIVIDKNGQQSSGLTTIMNKK